MLTARTLAEAQVYVSLSTAADSSVPPTAPPPIVPGPDLIEGEDAWTVRSTAGEITVPYASEDAARTIGALFGLGVSQLIDAAQWAVVAATYGRRALDADLAYNGRPDDDREQVEQNWQAAAEAIGEAMKFLPEGADDAPTEAVWSDLGRESRANNPHLLTRAKLEDDLEYYEGTLSDFRAVHGES